MTRSRPPGARVTLADVAARAGVSRSLASLVIRRAPGPSAASRAAVLKAVDETGYRPDQAAQLLRQHRSRRLGVVFDPGDLFHADLLEAVYPAAERRGFDVLLGARLSGRTEDRAVEGLIGSRCEGLILIGTEAAARELSGWGARLPVSVIGRRGRTCGVDGILSADGRGAAAAVDLLVGLGHRRIRHVDGGRRPGAAERRRGYRNAMQRHGLVADVVPGDNTEESGVRAASELLRDPDGVTALLASNDRCALGVLDTLLRAGHDVPGEYSVVGYDDSRIARLAHVNLTTIAQDTTRIGELAVSAIVDRLGDSEQPPPPRDVRLPPRLMIRGTTGPVPLRMVPSGVAIAADPVPHVGQVTAK